MYAPALETTLPTLDIFWMSRRACADQSFTDMGLHEAFTNGEILWCTVFENESSLCLGPDYNDRCLMISLDSMLALLVTSGFQSGVNTQ